MTINCFEIKNIQLKEIRGERRVYRSKFVFELMPIGI
jgi:hypothetical protein